MIQQQSQGVEIRSRASIECYPIPAPTTNVWFLRHDPLPRMECGGMESIAVATLTLRDVKSKCPQRASGRRPFLNSADYESAPAARQRSRRQGW